MFNIGKRIKDRRIELGMSAEDLAPLVGLSPATIYRYENGDIKKVNTTKLQPFARALQTTEAYLMGWIEESNESDASTETAKVNVSEAAMRIAKLFDSLDDAGKELINVVIDLQVKRMNGEQMKTKRIPLIKATDDSVIFAKYHAKKEVEEITEECETIAQTCE